MTESIVESSLDSPRLTAVLFANGGMRVANSAGGALVGFYIAYLAMHGRAMDAALVGALGVVFSVSELLWAVPVGVLADKFPPRTLLIAAALLGGAATQLFGISGIVAIFFLSRMLEGIAAATSGPPLLAHLTDITQPVPKLRGRVMGFFELSLLAGVALGGLLGGVLWDAINTYAFSALVLVYLVVALLYAWGAQRPYHAIPKSSHPLEGLREVLSHPLLLRLAPAWLSVNAILGMWLTHIGYQLSGPKIAGQAAVGQFRASGVGLVLLGFTLVFTIGVVGWGFLLARVPRVRTLRISLLGMFFLCLWIYLLNLPAGWSIQAQVLILVLAMATVMVVSGFTPTALTYLSDVAGESEGRGAAMGIYTFLYGLGNALGAAIGGVLAHAMQLNGLILGTLGLAAIAMTSLMLLPKDKPH